MAETYEKELKRKIEQFTEGIRLRNGKKYKTLVDDGKSKILDGDTIHVAVDLAYNDAKRTMNNIGELYEQKKDKQGNPDFAEDATGNKLLIKDIALKRIEETLQQYFSEPEDRLVQFCNSLIEPNPEYKEFDEQTFDHFHDYLCGIWCEYFKKTKKPELGTYGKAQKIVNMSFKYLRCCGDADNYRLHFQYCHMPLDSFTLEWFKREVMNWYKKEDKDKDKEFRVGKMSSWSAIENDEVEDSASNGKNYPYSYYLNKIRNYIKNKEFELSPLELEFFAWPEIQAHLAAEGFWFALKENMEEKEEAEEEAVEKGKGKRKEKEKNNKEKKNDFINETLDNKHKLIIKEIVKNW